MQANNPTTNPKPKYVNNAMVRKIQAPAAIQPALPALAPASEPRPSTAYVERHGRITKRQLDELTKTEREDLEQAVCRAAYVAMFNPCGLA